MAEKTTTLSSKTAKGGGNSPGCVSETSKKGERTDLGQRASHKSVKRTQPRKVNTSLLAPQSLDNATQAGITETGAAQMVRKHSWSVQIRLHRFAKRVQVKTSAQTDAACLRNNENPPPLENDPQKQPHSLTETYRASPLPEDGGTVGKRRQRRETQRTRCQRGRRAASHQGWRERQASHRGLQLVHGGGAALAAVRNQRLDPDFELSPAVLLLLILRVAGGEKLLRSGGW